MIFDNLGLPKDNGADDFADSARLAGILTVFEWPQKVDLKFYLQSKVPKNDITTIYVRHPLERKFDFSRDQTIPFIAGLYKQGLWYCVSEKYVDGKDWFSPSHKGHIRRCKAEKANWFQDLWLWIDVLWASFVAQMEENNQLLSILMIADVKYLKFYTKYNKLWEANVKSYWCNWRNEKELAEHIINKVKLRIK